MKKVLILALFFVIYTTANLDAQVTIGVAEEPSRWSLLDLKQTADGSSSKGLHLPRLSGSDRDALTASEKTLTKGLVIYNTTTNCLEYWNLRKWVSLCAGQANISFGNPNGTDAGDITQPFFLAAGGEKGPYVPHDEPDCTGKDPAYGFLVVSGDSYAGVIVENSTTGQFRLSMSANETAAPRHAIVRVTNNCTGEYREFVFTQEGNDSGCGTTASIPDIKSENSLNLCTGGAVYLYLEGRPTSGTYIWTQGEVEKGRGASFIATAPGTYKVYADKIGCTTAPPKTVTVTPGSTSAPSPVSVVAQNKGFICPNIPSDLLKPKLFASATGAGTIVWYKDGSKTAETGSSIDSPGTGVWFAVLEDGGCSSTPSNTVTVSREIVDFTGVPFPGPSFPIYPVQTFNINGSPSADTVNLCSGGTLVLDVTNPESGATYTWLMDSTEKGSGTHYEMSLEGVTSNFILQCRAVKRTYCSSAVIAVVNISMGSAPSQPTITVNTPGEAVCDGTATLTANATGGSPDSYIWYRSGSQNGTYSIVSGQNGQSLDITQDGWYKVAAGRGYCVSELSEAKGVTVYSGTASATISGEQSGINPGDTRTYTATMNNPQGASYSWKITGSANPTPTSGTGSSIAVRFGNAGTATLSLTAQNACGTATVANNNYAVTVSSSCTPVDISSHNPSGKEVTVTQGNISGSLSITASGSPALSYRWYQNTAATTTGGVEVGTNSAALTIPTDLSRKDSPYYYYCEVTSSCGGSSKATSDVFKVTVNLDLTGSGLFAGRTCFDVALVNDAGECGGLSVRQAESLTAGGVRADFSNALTRNQTYTFTPSGTVSNVRFYTVETESYTGQIIESIRGDNPGNNISSAVSCDIVYKSDLNAKASGRTDADALTVDIYVVYNDSDNNTGTDKFLKLTAKIKDCACCGAYTVNGTWLNFMCYNLGADPTLTMPDQIKNAPTSQTYGNYYQWVRSWPIPGQSIHISEEDRKSPSDPCPAGWRVPSRAQWLSIFGSSGTPVAELGDEMTWYGNTVTKGLQAGSLMYLPAAGYKYFTAGDVPSTGSSETGFYWTRDFAAYGYAFPSRCVSLQISAGGWRITSNYCPDHLSIRCVED